MSDKKIRVGIIGTGSIAGAHLGQYLKFDDVEIVAGADIIPGKADDFFAPHEQIHARTYTNHLEMLEKEDLDVVSVCTYNREHCRCTIDALEHGCDVLLEKPMSVTLDEAVEMRRAEKRTGKFISVGFQPRFDANMRMIKSICESGTLGEIYYIQTGGGRRRGIPGRTFIEDKTAGIGALGDIGCYSLDMVLNAIGYPKPLTVSGYTSDFFGKNPKYTPLPDAERFSVDDFAAAFVRLEGGIILDFRIAWYMHLDTPGDTIIMGTKGSLRIPSTDCWNGSFNKPMTIYHDVAGEPVETVVPLLPATTDLFDRKIRSFLNAVITGSEAPVPTSQIIYNQAILDGIQRSSDCGHEVEIEIPEV